MKQYEPKNTLHTWKYVPESITCTHCISSEFALTSLEQIGDPKGVHTMNIYALLVTVFHPPAAKSSSSECWGSGIWYITGIQEEIYYVHVMSSITHTSRYVAYFFYSFSFYLFFILARFIQEYWRPIISELSCISFLYSVFTSYLARAFNAGCVRQYIMETLYLL